MRPSFVCFAIALSLVPIGFAGCAGSDDPNGGDNDRGAEAIVDKVYTVNGWMSLEDDYVPRVCTQENGAAATEALKAQAVAARTYVLRAMRDDPTLGTTAKPIENGQGFQTYAAQANAGCVAATNATRGQVGQYEDQLIIANYVAGAYWSNGAPTSDDPTATEHWVTYNNGLSGSAVHPTALSYLSRPDNRGCMSQNGSNALAQAGQGYAAILRYFYGADLELATLDGSGGPEPAHDDTPMTQNDPTTHDDPTSESPTDTESSSEPSSDSDSSTWPSTDTTTTSSTTWP